MDENINKDELRKSLLDIFSTEEVDQMIEKAEKEGKFDKKEMGEKSDDEKTVDEEAVEKEDEDDDDVKKAYDKIMSMKSDLDKSMTNFLDKFGKMPGVKTPDTDITKKAEEDQLEKKKEVIEKSEVNDFEKAFGSKFDEIQKSFTDRLDAQSKVNEEIVKALHNVSETVNQIAQTPNPLKALTGKYQFIEKGEKTDENGKRVVSLRDKEAVQNEISKAIDKISDETDQQIVRDLLSDYTVTNRVNPKGLNIVKKALDIEFEK